MAMRQFDVLRAGRVYVVVIESDQLFGSHDVFVAPLEESFPAAAILNPVLRVDGRDMALMPRQSALVRRSALTPTGHSLAARRDEIVRAFDFMLGTY